MPRVDFMPFKCQTTHNFSRRAFLFQCSHLFPLFSVAASQALPSSDVVSVTSILRQVKISQIRRVNVIF